MGICLAQDSMDPHEKDHKNNLDLIMSRSSDHFEIDVAIMCTLHASPGISITTMTASPITEQSSCGTPIVCNISST